MRIAIITESFLPAVNGVAGTVRHVTDHLVEAGHEVVVVAPRPGPASYGDTRVVRTRAMALPGYPTFTLGLPDRIVDRTLLEFAPDVVHLASPVALGAVGLAAARRRGLPILAVYQTDLGGFARGYRIPAGAAPEAWTGYLHRLADRTLVPSSSSLDRLSRLGVPELYRWGRGVDLTLFGPQRRHAALHDRWTGSPDTLAVGYVGRLAAEKQVDRLVEIAHHPRTRLVVVGDGPERARLEALLPQAVFTGMLHGADLARALASLDVFVHTGTSETFCQTVQEAQASGVAVVAPAAGGPLDLVAPGRTGLLFDPRRPLALTEAVDALVADPRVRSRLTSTALAGVAGRSWSATTDALVQHYRELVSSVGVQPTRPRPRSSSQELTWT